MECVSITPSKLRGTVKVPPSKSLAHRAVICGGLSNGQSLISNIDYSDDINATIGGMRALGSDIEKKGNSLLTDGSMFMAKRSPGFPTVVDCIESGTTLRMLLPLSLIRENSAVFVGRGNLGKRPLDTYFDIFNSQGIEYKSEKDELNLKIRGCLKSGEFKVRGDISSQFISGLLMALPLLEGDSRIVITTKMESKGYIDLTIDMLNKFGVEIVNSDYEEFFMKGRQSFKPCDVAVEGDFSQAAFFLAAGALGSQIECENLSTGSHQGDRAVIDILKSMGCNIESGEKYVKAYSESTKCTVIDGSQIPDIVPVLAVVASLSRGITRIINAGRLRVKECDRLKAMYDGLSKLGADIEELQDGFIINGRETLKGGEVDSYNDHRIAMALAIASTMCEDRVIIKNSGAVKKSYPGFWNDFKSLGGNIDGWNMG